MKRLNRPLAVKTIDDAGVFEGYGSVFGVEDSYRDVVLPGAFSKSLASWRDKKAMPPLLWQHQHDKPIGVYEAMAEDEHGLFVRGRLLVQDVSLAKEAWALLKAGAIKGLSIGYRPVLEEYNHESKVNNLKEIDLWETSLVTFPANEDAVVTSIKTVREFEKFLREAGFSRSEATRIASSGFGVPHGGQRDSDVEAVKAALKHNIKTLENMTHVC